MNLLVPAVNQSESSANDTVTLKEWRLHLLRQNPQRMVPVIALSVFVFVAGYLYFHTIWPSIAGVFLLCSSCSEYLLISKFRLTDQAAHATNGISRFEIAWKDVKRLLISESAVTLSPLTRPSRLDNFRGVTLRFPADGSICKEEIIAIIEERVKLVRSPLDG